MLERRQVWELALVVLLGWSSAEPAKVSAQDLPPEVQRVNAPLIAQQSAGEARDAYLNFKGLSAASELGPRLDKARSSTGDQELTYWVAVCRWHHVPGFGKLDFDPQELLKTVASTRPEARRVLEAIRLRDPALHDGDAVRRLADEAASERDSVALLELSESLIVASDGKRRDLEAVAKDYARQALELGNQRALYTLSYFKRTLDRDVPGAIVLLKQAAEAGDYRAAYDLALAYGNGRGVERSPQEAIRWFEQGASLHHPPSLRELGKAAASGFGTNAPNLERARELFLQASELGDGDAAMFVIGGLLNGELGFAVDHEEGLSALRKLAEQGHPRAMYVLGMVFKTGSYGVATDAQSAEQWLQKSAAKGFELARDELSK